MIHFAWQRRSVLPAATAALIVVGLTACAGGDPVTPGVRDHQPTASASTSPNPETDPAKLAIKLSSLPGWTAPTAQGAGVFGRSILDEGGQVTWKVFDGENKVVDHYAGSGPVAFGDSSVYTQVGGVLTFRGNNYRDAPAYGTAEVKQKKLEVVWAQATGDVKA